MSVNLNSLDKDQLPFPHGQPIKTIKNMATNQYLSVISQPIDEETYAIRANDHCLYVYDNNDYSLKPCALTEDFVHPQYFQAKKIINDVAEARMQEGHHQDDSNTIYSIPAQGNSTMPDV